MRFGTALELFVPKSFGAGWLAGARRGVGADIAGTRAAAALLPAAAAAFLGQTVRVGTCAGHVE